MKYIDADKLIALIDAKLEDLGMSGSVWVGRSVLNELKDDIESLQQEQPSLPSNLDEAAGDYIFIHEHAPSTGNHPWVDAFKAGAEWMAGQGETIVTRIMRDDVGDLVPTISDLSKRGLKVGDNVVVQIRKK